MRLSTLLPSLLMLFNVSTTMGTIYHPSLAPGSGVPHTSSILQKRVPSGGPRSGSPTPRPPKPRKVAAEVTVKGDSKAPWSGSTFVKNEFGKSPGIDDWYRATSRKKASAGGTQKSKGEMMAEASGHNLAVKLHVPPGSKGSYDLFANGGKTTYYVPSSEKTFRKKFEFDPAQEEPSIEAKLDGPGSVKAKAWHKT